MTKLYPLLILSYKITILTSSWCPEEGYLYRAVFFFLEGLSRGGI